MPVLNYKLLEIFIIHILKFTLLNIYMKFPTSTGASFINILVGNRLKLHASIYLNFGVNLILFSVGRHLVINTVVNRRDSKLFNFCSYKINNNFRH
jgi:hypothetical protein